MLEGPAGTDSRHEAGATARCTAIDGRWIVRRRLRLDRAEQRETASALGSGTAAQACWAVERAAQQAYEDPSPHPCGRPSAFAARIHAAVSDVVQTERSFSAQQLRRGGPQRSTGPASPWLPSPERPQALGAHRRAPLLHPACRRPRPSKPPYLMPLAA